MSLELVRARSFWIRTLILAVFIGYSKADGNVFLQPSNLQCACPNDRLRFTCTVIINDPLGSVVWEGTAFNGQGCEGNRISVRHSDASVGDRSCTSGTIVVRRQGINETCTTSELDIVVDSTVNNKTILCISEADSGDHTVGEAAIAVVSGPYQQAPGDVILTSDLPGEFTVSWAQVDPNCPTVKYPIISDCGNCSSTGTSATCSNLSLSATARNCTLSVSSSICGFNGPSSDSITVTLKIPGVPQVNLIPVYSGDSQTLTRLNIEISGPLDSFFIYEGISGSTVSYIIDNSAGAIQTIPADCMDGICENVVEVRPPFVCQSSSGDSTIRVSAANRLGPGQPSRDTVECANEFVDVVYNEDTSTIACSFSISANYSCSITYRLCQDTEKKSNTSINNTIDSNHVFLQIHPLASAQHCYVLTASNNTFAVMVNGTFYVPSDNGSSNAIAITLGILIPAIIILVLIIVVTIAIVMVKGKDTRKMSSYEVTDNGRGGTLESEAEASTANNSIELKHEAKSPHPYSSDAAEENKSIEKEQCSVNESEKASSDDENPDGDDSDSGDDHEQGSQRDATVTDTVLDIGKSTLDYSYKFASTAASAVESGVGYIINKTWGPSEPVEDHESPN